MQIAIILLAVLEPTQSKFVSWPPVSLTFNNIQKTKKPKPFSTSKPRTRPPTSPPTRPSSVCVDSGISYQSGELIGYVGLFCRNTTTVYSNQSYSCGPNGTLALTDHLHKKNYTCPSYTPYCHQCQYKALCFAEADPADVAVAHPGCDVFSNFNTTTSSTNNKNITVSTPTSPHSMPTSTVPTGCLVGDTTFQFGETIGRIGFRCYSDTDYVGAQFFCGSDGAVQARGQNLTCSDTSTSKCYQCNNNSEAFCHSSSSLNSKQCTLGGDFSKEDDFAYIQWITRMQDSTPEASPTNYSGYCGILSADGSSGICNPNSKNCTSDNNCIDSLYSMCLSSCDPIIALGTDDSTDDDSSDDDSSDDDGSDVDDDTVSTSTTNITQNGCAVERGVSNTSTTIIKPGYTAGYIGFFCLSNSTFSGDVSYCGVDGDFVAAKSSVLSCPPQAPHCFQCGEATTPGAAVCVPNRYLYPDGCLPGGLYDANNTETTGDKRTASVSFSSAVSPMSIPKKSATGAIVLTIYFAMSHLLI